VAEASGAQPGNQDSGVSPNAAQAEADSAEEPRRVSRLVALAQSFVQEHWAETEFNVRTVSQLCGTHIVSLGRAFKRDTGMSLKQYLLEFRVHQAEKLLKNTNLTVQDIAWEVGIAENTYFSTVFKKITGKTPSDYIQEHRTVKQAV
jgi:two-component system response regulator YesN